MSRRVPPNASVFRGPFAALLLALAFVSITARSADLVISEFMADNETSLLDEDGAPSDWIELHNASASPVSTAGWSLTDDPALPRKWVFPERVLAAGIESRGVRLGQEPDARGAWPASHQLPPRRRG
jgi:hypothetical protein